MGVKFRGVICPNVLKQPTFRGRAPRNEKERYELDMAKVKAMTSKLNGKPIRDSHKTGDLGRIVKNWVDEKMQWWVEFEIDNPEAHIDYIERIRDGKLGNLSLQHWSKTLNPTEVSICEVPVRDGSAITTEVCDHPESCGDSHVKRGSSGSFYKESADTDVLISAARTVDEADALEIDSTQRTPMASGKDTKGTDAGSGGPLGMPSDHDMDVPPSTSNGVSQLAGGGNGQPLANGEGSKKTKEELQKEEEEKRKQQQLKKETTTPAGKSQPQAQPQGKKETTMDESDDHSAASSPQGADSGAAGGGAAAVPAKSAQELALEQQRAHDRDLINRLQHDKRVDKGVRDEIYEMSVRQMSEINQLKRELEIQRKNESELRQEKEHWQKIAGSTKTGAVKGFTDYLQKTGGNTNDIMNLEQFFASPAGDKFFSAGGDTLISACRALGKHGAQVDEFDVEADKRARLFEHLQNGGLADEFNYGGTKPTAAAAAVSRQAKTQKPRKTLTGGSGMSLDSDAEGSGATGDFDEAEDEKVSAARTHGGGSSGTSGGKEEKKTRSGGGGGGWSPGHGRDPADDDFMKWIDGVHYDVEPLPLQARVNVEPGTRAKRRHPHDDSDF